MVYLTLENNLWVKVETTDRKCFDLIKENFTFHVDGYWFMPLYKEGKWDGKICLFDYKHRRLPYGLLLDLIRILKKNKHEIKISDEIKNIFGNKEKLKINYDLKYKPRYYQQDIIEKFFKYKRSLFVSPTASGKSLSIAYIIKILFDNNLIKKSVIIVPTTNLILQFYSDLIDYGVDKSLLGKYYAEEKESDKPILISTWQSLCYDYIKINKSEIKNLKKELKKKTIKKEDKEKREKRLAIITSDKYQTNINSIMKERKQLLESMDFFVVDEVQHVKSTEVNNLTKKLKNAQWRCGCTGTLPNHPLDRNNIKSFIGPISSHYKTKELTDEGFLNECTIYIDNLKYKEKITGKYNDVKDTVFSNPYRLNHIKNRIRFCKNDNVLLLVGKIAKEGKILENYLKEQFPNKKIKFLYSNVKASVREEWRQKCIKEKNVIIIAVYQLFQSGINIPNLNNIILASSFKSEIRILQSIGRTLRLANQKSRIFDIVDKIPILKKHIKERRFFYKKEEHPMIEKTFEEI